MSKQKEYRIIIRSYETEDVILVQHKTWLFGWVDVSVKHYEGESLKEFATIAAAKRYIEFQHIGVIDKIIEL